MRRVREFLLLIVVGVLLVTGSGLWFVDPGVGRAVWAATTVVALAPALVWVSAELRRGRYGADLLAVMALASTLAVGEYLAGAVIALMVATGRALEAAASSRASRDLSALLARAPTTVHLRRAGDLVTVPVDQVVPGDRVVVLPGEVVPVDAVLDSDGLFDESALTGEPEPVPRAGGDPVRSGVANAGAAVDTIATASADASTYAGVLRLAEQAQAESAPVARIADRVAVWFLPLTLVIAGVAWLLSGDPVRAVAVLVTATPCPLLLAVPIAVSGGLSRMSRAGVVVKGGASLEQLGHARTILMDKTGTVTTGNPEIVDVVCAPGTSMTELLAAAAGVERYSAHVLAATVVRAAQRAGVTPAAASAVTEEPGWAVTGTVAGRRVSVGRIPDSTILPEWARAAARRSNLDLASVLWVTVDGTPVAALLVRDSIRPDAARTMRRLREAGIEQVALLTGDRVANATEVASMLGLDEVHADASPADKITRVRAAQSAGTTVMIGDGVNDAPALAAADIGVALGSRGSTAAVQAADAVITDDRIDRIADAVDVARRTRRIALQSALSGTALSLLAMAAAAVGWLAPVAGALVQEGIDVAVILNALRAVRGRSRRTPAHVDALLRRFASEHDGLHTARAAVRQAADALAHGTGPRVDAAVRRADELVATELLPHEHAEETVLYPALAEVLGGAAGTVTMSRAHAEIERLARRLRRHVEEAEGGIAEDQIGDLRATLYGLDAILTLHFAQEEEAYFSLSASAFDRETPRTPRRGTGGSG
ncbi:heavy metal translocating P-type ATPase [Haloechinothrix sp. LS1_15]|uniref:heavy metal translocating P-type ATPase n=1 Tax=Haloechinothrix sp. LS1_15 TaxID=2652248 RepID=UPI0029457960|nr:heavy metal translocating P-type ATPase [Haloechinothrix sp. LS1_15]MDV6014230.1 heavy metal translocating P-type ATPase [Haloechinothrix sp. LS1_15]